MAGTGDLAPRLALCLVLLLHVQGDFLPANNDRRAELAAGR